MKTCFKCKQRKPLGDFYTHQRMSDGHLNKCKECTKKDAAKHRIKNIKKIREYDRMRAAMPHRIKKSMEISAIWRAKHPERKKAQTELGMAVKRGLITPLPCLICGDKAEAHHPDYSRPLDVVWLCSPHHKQAHALAR